MATDVRWPPDSPVPRQWFVEAQATPGAAASLLPNVWMVEKARSFHRATLPEPTDQHSVADAQVIASTVVAMFVVDINCHGEPTNRSTIVPPPEKQSEHV